MKLYTIYTDSHLPFLIDWFLPSLQDNFELIIKKAQQISKTGSYMEKGWAETMYYKVDIFVDAVKHNISKNEVFIFSDIDIQFFDKIESILMKHAKGYDIVFQKGGGSINAGFFLCRSNQKTLRFWKDVKRMMRKRYKIYGEANIEDSAKILLGLGSEYKDKNCDAFKWAKNKYGLKWKYLPVNQFVGGQYCVKSFASQILVPPPPTLVMHHATSTIGFDNKIRQLKYVKKQTKKYSKKKC